MKPWKKTQLSKGQNNPAHKGQPFPVAASDSAIIILHQVTDRKDYSLFVAKPDYFVVMAIR